MSRPRLTPDERIQCDAVLRDCGGSVLDALNRAAHEYQHASVGRRSWKRIYTHLVHEESNV